jgi:uncharacterized membrane protein
LADKAMEKNVVNMAWAAAPSLWGLRRVKGGNMPENRFSIGDAVSFGWEVMKNNLGFLIPAVLIMWFINSIPNGVLSPFYLARNAPAAAVLGFLVSILSFVVGIFVLMAQIRIGLKFCSSEVPDFPDMVSDYRRFWDVLVGSILYFLIVMAGFILLIIPGIYWGVRYYYFSYLILDQGMSPVDAIKRSGQITRGVWWHLFVFWLAAFGIMILGFMVCCVGALFAWPVVIIATAYVYRSLLATAPAVQQPGPPPVPQQPTQ